MRKRTVTTIECDLCGAEETSEQWHSNLPSGSLGVWDTFATNSTGEPNTYCTACVDYVQEQRDAAIAHRRSLRGVVKADA